jgi:ElaB/YqjD/DUF883 family membrane-anchored ribosome-binding protein
MGGQIAKDITVFSQRIGQIASTADFVKKSLDDLAEDLVSLVRDNQRQATVNRETCQEEISQIVKETNYHFLRNRPWSPASSRLYPDRVEPARLELARGVNFRCSIQHTSVDRPLNIAGLVLEIGHLLVSF